MEEINPLPEDFLQRKLVWLAEPKAKGATGTARCGDAR